MIQVTDLSFSHGDKPLYQGVNFIVGSGQKVGIVGPNGSGKSTLLSIINGNETGYVGRVKVIGAIGHVPQEIKHDPLMEAAISALDYVDPNSNYQEHEIKKMLKGLELEIDLLSNPKKFSGGQKTKLALARALLLKPKILLLDEPTNFMDTAGTAWVMNFLANYEGCVIVISHDIALMDKSLNKILAIAPYNSTIKEYSGTYSDYLRLKKLDEVRLKKEHEVQKRYIKRLEEGYMDKSQFDATKSILRRKIAREIDKLPEIPPELKKIKIKLPEPKKVGEIPIRAINVSKSYGDKVVLRNVNFTIIRNEKVVLIGPNGVGKSTFIKILMDMVGPDMGRIEKDINLSVGYYSQEFETFDFDKTVIKTFCDGTNKPENFARSFLGNFLFSNQKVYQRVGSLSGGEKTRLSIAILTASDHNLLILDEPTTYLDVMSQRIILETLKNYLGTLILVSHSPEFVKEINLDKAFLFPSEKMVYWDENLLLEVEKQ